MYKLSIFFMYDFSSLLSKTELVQTYKLFNTAEYRKIGEIINDFYEIYHLRMNFFGISAMSQH